jgi:hypothetical protein
MQAKRKRKFSLFVKLSFGTYCEKDAKGSENMRKFLLFVTHKTQKSCETVCVSLPFRM